LGSDVYDGTARAAIARALGRIGLPEALPALRKALSARESIVRAAAVEGLRNIEGLADTAGAAAALPALSDVDADVRAEAAYTIGSLRRHALTGEAAATDAAAKNAVVVQLGRLVSTDPSALVRKRAAWALGEIGASATLVAAALEQAATHDSDPLVRSIAGAALGSLSR
jgi:HEAT repeat protein